MRKWLCLIIISTAALVTMLFISASNTDVHVPFVSNARIYQVAILPICNPGTSCDPKIPLQLRHSFFKHYSGVAAFINQASNGHARVHGTSTPWLRPRQKIKSAEEVINRSEELINLANEHIKLTDFDVVVLYTKVSGSKKTISWPAGQIIKTPTNDIRPAIAIMLNTEIFAAPTDNQPISAILPSIEWAQEFLKMLQLSAHAHALKCENTHEISSCELGIAQDPFSVLGQASFSLLPNWAMRRAIGWTQAKDIIAIRNNGTYHIDQNDNSLPRALEIYLPMPLKLNESTSFNRIFVEPKLPIGFDGLPRKLINNDIYDDLSALLKKHSTGAFLYFGYQQNNVDSTALIDTKISKNTVRRSFISHLIEMADSQLLPGQDFKVFDSSITLRVLKANNTSLTIQVLGF